MQPSETYKLWFISGLEKLCIMELVSTRKAVRSESFDLRRKFLLDWNYPKFFRGFAVNNKKINPHMIIQEGI